MVERGRNDTDLIPILIDFGKSDEAVEERADASKFSFLAPEIFTGNRKSTRSDIFSLGYTLRRISHVIKDSSLKQIYRSCLLDDPLKRPEIKAILGQLK